MSDDTIKSNPADLLANLRERVKEGMPERTPEEIQQEREAHERLMAQCGADYEAAKLRYALLDVPPNVPKIFAERVARLRKEVFKLQDWFSQTPVAERSPYALSEIIDLMDRVCALMEWLQQHRDETILCFSTDPNDVECYCPTHWGTAYIRSDDDDFDEWYDLPPLSWFFSQDHENSPGEWLKMCNGAVSHFQDASLWEIAAQTSGTDRYYLAFES